MSLPRAALVALPTSLFLCAATGAAQVRLEEQQKLTPTALVGADKHGQALAIDGDRLLVGAPEATTTGSGRVYAYDLVGGSWSLVQTFSFVLGGQGSAFGRRLALDGDTALVANASSAFAFVRAGGSWALQRWLASPASTEYYGSAVAVDGDTALVGQPATSVNQVWVWTRAGTQWSVEDKLEPPNPPQTIGFGEALAIVGDTAIVGAGTDDQAGSNAGAVYVFTRSGSVWSLQATLIGSPAYPGRRLGRAISAQALPGGEIELAVGAPGPTSGEVLVFRGGGATWVQTERLVPAESGSWFGNAVALDGDLLVVGAWLADGGAADTGLATVFRRCGDDWVRQADLLGSDTASGDNFGLAVALQDSSAFVGAPSHDQVIPDGGSSYVFDLEDSPLTVYCAGDGSGAACPCGNEGPAGAAAGCVNSTGAGARLVLDDALEVSTDGLHASSCELVPGEAALLFAGLARVEGGAGAAFGDGLRCAGTGVVRLGTTIADSNGGASWGPGLGALGGWSAGETRQFQVWYRDPTLGPCASGFNLSNGVSARFEP